MKSQIKYIFLFTFACLNYHGQNCANINFEASVPGDYSNTSSIPGWSISSRSATSCTSANTFTAGSPEFSLVSTPFSDPILGILPNSPYGGTVVAAVHNTLSSALQTRLIHQFLVTSSTTIFQFAYAGVWSIGNHTCCEQAGFEIHFSDTLGNIIPCLTTQLGPSSASTCAGETNMLNSNGTYYTNWRLKLINLASYLGQNLQVWFVVKECIWGDHFSKVYLDLTCLAPPPCNPGGLTAFSNNPQVVSTSFCAGSNLAQLCAPIGYVTYSWVAPSGASAPLPVSQATLSCITVPNPIPGSTYTVYLSSGSGCLFVATGTVYFSNVSITAIGASPSCSLGSSGSASVAALGSGAGYSYTWTNSSNSVVSTSFVASNLSTGTYTVRVKASDQGSCGTATATVAVGVRTGTLSQVKPFCGNTAYLNAGLGSNFQWYNSFGSISPTAGGTSSLLTINSPLANSNFWLSYSSPQGCLDTIRFTLLNSNPGSLSVLSNTVCSNATNGQATLNINSTAGISGLNSFTVLSLGTTPNYSLIQNYSSLLSQSLTGLAGGNYTVNLFDGSCILSNSFTVVRNNASLTTGFSSASVCAGNSIAGSMSLINAIPNGSATYLWLPNQFLSFNNNLFPNTIITPTSAPGIPNVIIYTVSAIVNPGNCSLSKTLSVTSLNPITPTIISIPDHCSNAPQFTISTSPPGGIFQGSGVSTNGVLVPSSASVGVNNLQYQNYLGSCFAAASATYQIKPAPAVSIKGNTLICIGQTTSLTAQGAQSYTWSNSVADSINIVSPIKPTNLSVTGTSTNGCTNSVSINFHPVPVPTIQLFGTTTLCAGDSALIVASGANSYSWNTGQTGAAVKVSPAVNSTFTVTGYNSSACAHSLPVSFIVKNNPVLSVTGPTQTCAGSNLILTANGAANFKWNSSSASNPFTSTPTTNVSYTLVGIDTNGCISKKIISIYVLPSPTLFTLGDESLCSGESITLTVFGANKFVWSHNSSTLTTQLFQPTINTVYTVTGTDTTGCSASMAVSLIVFNCVGVEENENQTTVQVFPSPVTNKLIIKSNEKISVQLFDIQSRSIRTENLSDTNNEIDLSTVPTGVYHLHVLNANREILIKKKITKID